MRIIVKQNAIRLRNGDVLAKCHLDFARRTLAGIRAGFRIQLPPAEYHSQFYT